MTRLRNRVSNHDSDEPALIKDHLIIVSKCSRIVILPQLLKTSYSNINCVIENTHEAEYKVSKSSLSAFQSSRAVKPLNIQVYNTAYKWLG